MTDLKENGVNFLNIKPAILYAKDNGKLIVSYCGTGIDIFGYYAPNHSDVVKAISEYKESVEQTTGCKLSDSVIDVSTVG